MQKHKNLPATKDQTDLANYVPTAKEIKQMICPKATDAEIALFIQTMKATGLNVFLREIYLVKYDKDLPASIVTGYQTYLQIAEGSGLLDGWDVVIDDEKDPTKATITIHRKDWSHPFVWTVYRRDVDTSHAKSKPKNPWVKQPRHMLRKCAIGMGMRLCFPNVFRGTPYLPEEMTSGVQTDEETSESLANISYQDAEIIDAIPGEEQTEPEEEKSKPDQPPAQQAGTDTGSNVLAQGTYNVLRAKYFYQAGMEFETNEPRRAWQLKTIGKGSIKNWTVEDFEKATDILSRIERPPPTKDQETEPAEEALTLDQMIKTFPQGDSDIPITVKDHDAITFYLNTRFLTLDLTSRSEILKQITACYTDQKKGAQLLSAVGKAAAWGEQIGGRGKARKFIEALNQTLAGIPDPEAAAYFLDTTFASLGVTNVEDGVYRLTLISAAMFDSWNIALNGAVKLTTVNFAETQEPQTEKEIGEDDDLPFF